MPDDGQTGNPQQGAGGEGTQPGQVQAPEAVNWEAHIPQEYASEKLWEPVKNQPLSTVLKGYAEAQKMRGNSLQLPSKEDDAEGWKKVWTRLGAGEKPEDYQYDTNKWQGKFEFDQDAMGRFQKIAHENNMTKKQYEKLMDWYTSEVVGKVEAVNNQDANNVAVLETKLKNEYGPNWDYNKGVALKGLYEYTQDQDAVNEIHEVMKRNEKAYKAFVKLGQELVEHKKIEGVKYEDYGAMSPDKAMEEIRSIQGNRKHAYFNPKDPGYEDAQRKVQDLYKVAYQES